MTVSINSEYASKFSCAYLSVGGVFLFLSIYWRSWLMSVNVCMAGLSTGDAGATIKPFMFISISSSTSENMVFKLSIALISGCGYMPTAPIHNVSPVPIARSAGLKLPMFEAFLTV